MKNAVDSLGNNVASWLSNCSTAPVIGVTGVEKLPPDIAYSCINAVSQYSKDKFEDENNVADFSRVVTVDVNQYDGQEQYEYMFPNAALSHLIITDDEMQLNDKLASLAPMVQVALNGRNIENIYAKIVKYNKNI